MLCRWRSWRAMQPCWAMQPMLEPLVELMYGNPCAIAIAKAPRARGSCVLVSCVCVWCVWCVWCDFVCRRTLSFIVHRLHAAVVVAVDVVNVFIVCCWQTGRTVSSPPVPSPLSAASRRTAGTGPTPGPTAFNCAVARPRSRSHPPQYLVEYYCAVRLHGWTAGRLAQRARATRPHPRLRPCESSSPLAGPILSAGTAG